MNDLSSKISVKKVIGIVLLLFFIAVIGVVLILLEIEMGRYLVYFSVPIGALLTMVTGLLVSLGLVKKDF